MFGTVAPPLESEMAMDRERQSTHQAVVFALCNSAESITNIACMQNGLYLFVENTPQIAWAKVRTKRYA